jgi:hypothetical protein
MKVGCVRCFVFSLIIYAFRLGLWESWPRPLNGPFPN